MPPVLDIALNELPCGGPQYLRVPHRVRHVDHHVLELIEAIAAGLMERDVTRHDRQGSDRAASG